jgi:signal transduction histidine kinase/CheY-like chemotaxis protein
VPSPGPAEEGVVGRGRPPRRRSIDLKALLLVLPLLVAIPLLGYGGFLLRLMADQATEHARSDQAAAQAALQATLVGELQHVQQTLQILAESPALRAPAPDVERAASLAQRVLRAELPVRLLAVLDRSGNVVVESPAPARPRAAVRLTPHQREVIRTGRTSLSGLHETPLAGRASVTMDVPVRRGGHVAWIITALLDPAQLTRTLSAQVGQRDAVSTVLDGRRRIVLRTRELDRFFGELPSTDTLRALDARARGSQRLRTRDGNEYLWTWSTIPSGWTVFLGRPAREFDDTLRGSMVRLGSAGLGVLLLAMAATALLARRIAGSVNRMAANAHRLTEGERPAYRASGIRQLDLLYEALEDASDQVSRAFADRRRALEAERAARAVADEHNRSKDLFLGMLSHELRNPLAPIRNSVHILQHAEAGSEQARRARAVIDRQTEHLTRIVDDLLDVTRIARGKILLQRARVDLRETVLRAAEDARPAVEQRGLCLRVELPRRMLWADADATRLTQVLGNLVHNSAKFTPPGGEISVRLREAEGAAEIAVRDTGVGIDPELLPQLFDPFVQGARTLARSEGGLGLGLALVKALVELHGGTVRAHSAGVGEGAELVVTLPLAADQAERVGREAAPALAARPRRVLVVDDNHDAAESLGELVALLGHEVEIAYDGRSAIEMARERRPDVVLCDIGLPEMTGYDVARALRAEHDGTLRLVAVSGYAQVEDVRRARDSGFDAHVPKPPDPERIEGLLGGEAVSAPVGLRR